MKPSVLHNELLNGASHSLKLYDTLISKTMLYHLTAPGSYSTHVCHAKHFSHHDCFTNGTGHAIAGLCLGGHWMCHKSQIHTVAFWHL